MYIDNSSGIRPEANLPIFLPSLLDRERLVIPPGIVFWKIYFLKKEEAMGWEMLTGAIK